MAVSSHFDKFQILREWALKSSSRLRRPVRRISLSSTGIFFLTAWATRALSSLQEITKVFPAADLGIDFNHSPPAHRTISEE